MSGVKAVSRHEEDSASGGSFTQQGGLIAQQDLAIFVMQLVPICHQGGSTNSTGGPNKGICGPMKQICGPT